MRVLLTGGAGFIGHHMVEHFLTETDWEVQVLDKLTYAGSLGRLAQFKDNKRFKFVYHDFRSAFSKGLIHQLEGTDVVIHAGAETHVENSIQDPEAFVLSNVVGTFHMLELVRQILPERYVHISTDEVFGPAPDGVDFLEGAPYAPSNPYAATKAGAESLVVAYAKCYQVPAILTRTMNNFGERQHPEKYVPMVIRNVLQGKPVTVHACGDRVGSRKWLHARNHASAVQFLIDHKALGQYHIAGVEQTNLEIAESIADYLEKPLDYTLVDYHSSRPGHDLRYSLDDQKLRNLGWREPVSYDASLARTAHWTRKHPEWLVD